jgi:hypothetical protein
MCTLAGVGALCLYINSGAWSFVVHDASPSPVFNYVRLCAVDETFIVPIFGKGDGQRDSHEETPINYVSTRSCTIAVIGHPISYTVTIKTVFRNFIRP